MGGGRVVDGGSGSSTLGFEEVLDEIGEVADLAEQIWVPEEDGALQPVPGAISKEDLLDKDTTVTMGPAGTRPLDVPGPDTTGTIRVRTSRIRRRGDAVRGHSHYEIDDLLGTGASAHVYKAQQASCDRRVALKILKDTLGGNQAAQDALLYEAVVAGNLDHPNVVPIYDVGFTDKGLPFCAMKLATGPTWATAMPQRTEAENLQVIRSVARALQYAHSRGVVHRDIKPENIMLGEFGEVMLGDWGLAIGLHPEAKAIPRERCEPVAGTPGYMAPEMASGSVEEIDERSDIYQLGGLLFHMLTGQAPHPGDDNRARLTNAGCNVIVETHVRGPLLDIALRCMASLPDGRYASLDEFLVALDDYDQQRESMRLTAQGRQQLASAESGLSSDSFARAVFSFDEALQRWPDNQEARQAAIDGRLTYARKAFADGDFDLADSLLDTDDLRGHPLRYAIADQRHQRKLLEEGQEQLGDELVGLLRSLSDKDAGGDVALVRERCRDLLRQFGHRYTE